MKMDELGAEVSLKIRSAIKAKLVELGAYVDDELPDYIMVMVANKRSKIQMENDLNLFLGNNTTNFTSWLHTVLVKLQEVTIANSQKKALPSAESAGIEKVAKSSKPVSGESEVHKHSSKHKKKSKKSLDSKKRSSVSKKSERSSLDNLKSIDTAESLKADGSKIKTADSAKGKESKKKDLPAKSSSKSELTKSLALLDSKIESLEAMSRSQRDTNNEASLQEESLKLDSRESGLLSGLRGSEDKSEALTAATKVVSELVAPANPRKVTLMQSDDEDFEDVINIRDAEMSEFLDAELDEGTPKALAKKLAGEGVKSSPTIPAAVNREQMEVDDLEEQRAKLLRDIELLGKIKAERLSSRNAADKYSVDSSTKSVPGRSDRLDIEPRLKLIDPDEFNISGPPAVAEVPKLKLADRLGRRTNANSDAANTVSKKPEELTVIKPLASGEGRRIVTAMRDGIVGDVPKRSIKDRLGEKQPSADDNITFKNPTQVNRKIDTSILSKLIENKNAREQKLLILERRGREEPEESQPKLSISDRLGKKRELDDRTVSSSSDRSKKTLGEREAFKSRFMDRLGKRVASSSSEEDVHVRKRLTRIKAEDDAQSGAKRTTDAAEQNDTDEPPRKRSVLSRVVAVSRESDDDNAEAGLAVASVIRVQPRPKIPAALQPNKNLLLKAMADAQKSVAAAPVRQEVKLPPGQLFTRKYRDGPSNPSQQRGEGRSSRNPSLSLVHKYHDIGPTKINITLEIPLEERQRTKQLSKSLQQRLNKSAIKMEPLDAAVDSVVEKQEIDEDTNEEALELQVETNSLIGNSNKDSDEENEVLEEYFGNEEDGLYETSAHASVNNSSIGYVSPIGEDRTNDEAIYIPSKIRYNLDGEDDAELNEDVYTPRSVRPSGGDDDTKFVVTMDGLDPAVYNPRKRTIEHQQMAQERPASPLPVMENERIHSWLQSVDLAKEREEHNERAVSPVVYKKPRLSERLEIPPLPAKPPGPCKYWPACRQGDQCEFTHPPSSLCKVFPNCKFGDKCIYVHPRCKFDLSCTRRDCPYSHGTSSSGAATAKAIPSPRARSMQTVCRFYPKCSNVNCSFLHPKPCRFGRACTKSDCVFHHGEVPSLEKLKWVKKSTPF